EKDRRIQQLQREIQSARDYQQTAIEEHQTAQEELKAAHEEALSINEEFQSTNEELETAKEELQSSNEELTTTNEELRNRNRELNEMNEKLRDSRDHLNAIIQTLREPLLVLDPQLKVLQANRAFYECFLTSRTEVEGRHIYELGDRQWDFPLLRRVLEDIIPKETELRDFEMTHAFPSIGTKTMRLNASKVTGAGRILLAFEDVTERAKALEDIKEANRQKDQFLAMLSHELRNPLAPIVNALRIMRLSGGLNPVGERARAVIERQVGQMTRLMSDLLEVARVTNGTILLYKKKTELKPMIERAIETARPTIDQRQHRLSVSVPSEPVWLNVDAARLEQVLVNLLTNAAKYTDPGGHIDLRAVAERDDSVTIFLSDTGIGMDSDLLPHVFEIFAQSPRSLARSQGGLGIGLSVARNLVELHGGTIEAHSEGPGKGSEFIVRLPRSNPHEVQREAAPREAARAPKDEPRRVLIVDDSADTTASAAELFADFGHDVRIASSGSEALEMAAQYRPDVILLDIGLPGMNGYEVADRLRQDARFKDVLMIAISGYGQESDRQRSLAAGFDEHLVKPVDLEKLEELLTEKINLKRAAG
ncbi:MAG: ATP-binding protein, partial [Candidatus Binataceae bacterium]